MQELFEASRVDKPATLDRQAGSDGTLGRLLNLERAQEIMERENLEALVATSPENVTYLSGYDHLAHYVWDELLEVFAVLSRDGTVDLVGSTDVVHYIAERPAEIDAMYLYGEFPIHRDPSAVLDGAEARVVEIEAAAVRCNSSVDGLRRVLLDRSIGTGRVAVDESGLSADAWRDVNTSSARGVTIVEGASLLQETRMIKTEPEIERLRVGVSAVEAGIRTMFQALVVGISESELETVFRAEVARLGTDPSFVEAAGGTRSGGLFPTSQYCLADGDVFRVDCGGRFGGYWADTGRTAVLGRAKATTLVEYYDALRSGIEAMLEIIQPGLPLKELVDVAVSSVRANGLPHYERRHVGHGIGANLYEAPILLESPEAGETIHVARSLVHATGPILEAGMVINIELPYYEFGLGGLQIEDTVVVRDSGPEVLTSNSRDLYLG